MYFLSFLENTPWFACVVSAEACSNKNASRCSFIFCFNILKKKKEKKIIIDFSCNFSFMVTSLCTKIFIN